ncbi:DUF6517 family protein [Halobaculum marinum]|uniref:DUF6517 family protein n=1 Tax=Halobaculum marinum TaxID=3031996 RepID=A0ABD5X1J8_9EURY|nr:DUF6517 family protein [Halobaculum sp. DT55]
MPREARRREFLRAAGGALTLGAASATSGCLGVISGEEPVTLSASPATVPETALAETGYAEYRVEPLEVTREFTVAGETREVVVTNHLAQYDKSATVFGERLRGAVFAALSTPAVELGDRTFNPVGDLRSRELAERLLARYDGFGDLRAAGEETVTVLGTETTVGLFTADATIADGIEVQVTLHVAEAVRAGPDFVVAIGGYPSVLTGQEADVRTMMQSLVHDEEAA